MSSKSNQNISTLLRNWLTGNSRLSEEEKLRKAANEDPFLAEAMEGYNQFPELNYTDHNQRLKERLRKRTQPGRSITLYSFARIAAAVLLLLTAGTAWWWINQTGAPEETAMEIEVQPPSTETEPNQQVEVDVPTEDAPNANSSNIPTPKEAEKSVAKKKEIIPQITPSTITAAPDAGLETEEEMLKDFEIEETPVLEEVEIAAKESKTENSPSSIKKRAKKTQDTISPDPFDFDQEEDVAPPIATVDEEVAPPLNSEKRLIMGVVKGRNGAPLIGANVVVKGTRNETITDYYGRFKIEVDASAEDVEANYIGFQSQTLNISSADNVEFVLEEGSQSLDQTKIDDRAYSNAQRQESQIEESASPIGGFKKFARYIKRNLNYPQAAKDANVSGFVQIQFTINQGGQLSDFRVLQSLGYDCDLEAIRLLKEGPAWEINSFDGSVITSYTFEFGR